MIDKYFCLSSYIAYRYIYAENMNFYNGMAHKHFKPIPLDKRISVSCAEEIDKVIQFQFNTLYEKYDNIGILLSGGMDSAILASYLKPGSHAYTFVAEGTSVFNLDEERAAYYCKKFELQHHLVNISFDDYKALTPLVMAVKCAPVHSIEPQILKAALMAKADGVDLIVVGESADLIFGGMDGLLSKDWLLKDFSERYTFLKPELVLEHPIDVSGLYEEFRQGDYIDFMSFLDKVFSIESSGSYMNAFETSGLPYYDPYALLVMRDKLDLNRVRNGESKYLVRNLYSIKYPEIPIPNKIPMPRPVDMIFKDWEGPKRKEFRKNIPLPLLTGNQKWQLWCAELFLDIYDK